MAGSFSGKRFPLLILLVSLFSSVHAIRESFDKFVRDATATTKNSYQTKQLQQSFYPQDEPGVGLYPSPPPPTHTPPPPYKNHYKTNAPPPPRSWLPKNFNPFQYTTNVKDQNSAYNPKIIEEEDKGYTTEFDQAFDPTDFLEDEEVAPPTTYLPGSFYQHKPRPQQGMSDTRFQKNGKYYYSVKNNNFPSREHPFNKIKNQYTVNDKKYNEGQTNKQSYNLDSEDDFDEDEQP